MTALRIANLTTLAALATLATLAFAAVASPVAAQPATAGRHDAPAASKQAQESARLHHGTGIVKALDGARATVTIAHEPIPSLTWPAMTMRFAVADAKLLEGLTPGAHVTFELRPDGNGRYVIASIRQ